MNIRKFKVYNSAMVSRFHALIEAYKYCDIDDKSQKRIKTAMNSLAMAICEEVEGDYLPEKRKFLVDTSVSAIVEAQTEEDATKQVYDSLMQAKKTKSVKIQEVQDWEAKEIDNN